MIFWRGYVNLGLKVFSIFSNESFYLARTTLGTFECMLYVRLLCDFLDTYIITFFTGLIHLLKPRMFDFFNKQAHSTSINVFVTSCTSTQFFIIC